MRHDHANNADFEVEKLVDRDPKEVSDITRGAFLDKACRGSSAPMLTAAEVKRKVVKKRWFFRAMHTPTAPQWWSNLCNTQREKERGGREGETKRERERGGERARGGGVRGTSESFHHVAFTLWQEAAQIAGGAEEYPVAHRRDLPLAQHRVRVKLQHCACDNPSRMPHCHSVAISLCHWTTHLHAVTAAAAVAGASFPPDVARVAVALCDLTPPVQEQPAPRPLPVGVDD